MQHWGTYPSLGSDLGLFSDHQLHNGWTWHNSKMTSAYYVVLLLLLSLFFFFFFFFTLFSDVFLCIWNYVAMATRLNELHDLNHEFFSGL